MRHCLTCWAELSWIHLTNQSRMQRESTKLTILLFICPCEQIGKTKYILFSWLKLPCLFLIPFSFTLYFFSSYFFHFHYIECRDTLCQGRRKEITTYRIREGKSEISQCEWDTSPQLCIIIFYFIYFFSFTSSHLKPVYMDLPLNFSSMLNGWKFCHKWNVFFFSNFSFSFSLLFLTSSSFTWFIDAIIGDFLTFKLIFKLNWVQWVILLFRFFFLTCNVKRFQPSIHRVK